jgi:hypothetical protein
MSESSKLDLKNSPDDNLRWALSALELAANGLKYRLKVKDTEDPATCATELWNVRCAVASIKAARELLAAPSEIVPMGGHWRRTFNRASAAIGVKRIHGKALVRRPFNKGGRKSYRDTLIENQKALDIWAFASGKPRLVLNIPEKRERVKREPDPTKPAVPLESAVNDDIYDAVCKRSDVKLWRNNRGVAQYGEQLVRYGVGPKGGADWIGYKQVYVTQAMVGKSLAVFVAIEAKRPGAKTRDDQQAFLDMVKTAGGIAGAATSDTEALEILG